MKHLIAYNYTQAIDDATDNNAIELVREYAQDLCQSIGEYMEVGKDANENRKTYDDITSLTVEEYVKTYLDDNAVAEDVFSNYEDAFEEAGIDENDVQNAVIDYISNDSFYTEDIRTTFNSAVQQFLNEHKETPGFLSTDKELIDTDSKQEVYSADSLLDLDDKIGDVTCVLQVIDYFSRDGAFVYIDGDVVYGGAGVPHQKILNDWLKEHDKKQLNKQYGDADNVVRPTMTETTNKTGAKAVAFGHIDNHMAFIETMENCTLDEVKNALNDYDKVYHYIRNNKGNFAKRIAHKHLEFFDQFATVEELLDWIVMNVNPTSHQEDNVYYTPQIIINEYKGNCMDIANFVRQYCLYKHIPNYIGQCGINYLSSEATKDISSAAHVVCIIQQKGLWYVAQADGINDPLTHLTKCIDFGSHSPLESLRRFAKSYLNGLSNWLSEERPSSIQLERFVRLLDSQVANQLDDYYLYPTDTKQQDFHALVSRLPLQKI